MIYYLSAFIPRPILKKIYRFVSMLHKNRWLLPIGLLLLYVTGMLLCWLDNGNLFSRWYHTYQWRDYINPFICLRGYTTSIGRVVIVMTLLLLFRKPIKRLLNEIQGSNKVHDDRGFEISLDGYHGTARFMPECEIRRYFAVGSLAELDNTLLGRIDGEIDCFSDYAGLQERHGFNQNICVVGASGSGKSRGFVEPFLLQALRRRESLVVVDPKGVMSQKYSGIFAESGYTMRYFNLVDQIQSDGWNPLVTVKENPDDAWMIAGTILDNCSSGHSGEAFWRDMEQTLLTALIHLVANGKKSGCLGDIYNHLTCGSIIEMERLFQIILVQNPAHPAAKTWNTFLSGTDTVKQSAVTGLASKLGVFQNRLIDTITRHDEIDLEAPGKERYAYFFNLPDNDTSLSFISSLFFTLSLHRLTTLAGHSPGGRLPVRVNFLLDEACNIGVIPRLKENLATVRSKNIVFQMIIQSIPQLMDRYPQKEWEDLLANMDTLLFLGCNDLTTAEYISKKSGSSTIRLPGYSASYESDTIRGAGRYTDNSSYVHRALLTPDEALRLTPEKSLAFYRGCHPLELYKISPEDFGMREHSFGKPYKHVPCWRKQELERQAKSKAAPVEIRADARKIVKSGKPPFDL